MAKETHMGAGWVYLHILALLVFLLILLAIKRTVEKNTKKLLEERGNLTTQNEYLLMLVDEFIVPKLAIIQKEHIKEGTFKLSLKNKGGALFNLDYTREFNSNIILKLGEIAHIATEQTVQVEMIIKKDELDELVMIRYNDKLKRTFIQKIIFKGSMIFMEPPSLIKHSNTPVSTNSPRLAWKAGSR